MTARDERIAKPVQDRARALERQPTWQAALGGGGQIGPNRRVLQPLLDEVAKGRATVLDRGGHGGRKALQFDEARPDFIDQRTPTEGNAFAGWLRCPGVVDRLQIINESFLVALAVMNERANVTKADLLEPMEYDVQSCAFLADEQHALSAGHVVGDEVGDRLRLAGAGWSLDNITLTGPGSGNGLRLARVGRQHRMIVPLFRRIGTEGASRVLRKQEVEIDVVTGRRRNEVRIVPHEGHFAVVEIGERDRAKIDLPIVRTRILTGIDGIEAALKFNGLDSRQDRFIDILGRRIRGDCRKGAGFDGAFGHLPAGGAANANIALENLHTKWLVGRAAVAV